MPCRVPDEALWSRLSTPISSQHFVCVPFFFFETNTSPFLFLVAFLTSCSYSSAFSIQNAPVFNHLIEDMEDGGANLRRSKEHRSELFRREARVGLNDERMLRLIPSAGG